jgi:hypothetical protein
MKNMAEFATKGTAGTALGLSIGALGAQVLSGGIGNLLGGITGNRQVAVSSEDMPITRYDMGLIKENTELKTEVKLRDANFYALGEVGKVRDELNAFKAEQLAYNAANTAGIGCIGQQVNQLQGVLASITQIKVPNSAVCPGWGNITITPATTPATGT